MIAITFPQTAEEYSYFAPEDQTDFGTLPVAEDVPVKSSPPVGGSDSCSCILGIRNFYNINLKGNAKDLRANTEPAAGVIALFNYHGIGHAAYVISVEKDGFYIDQWNKVKCKRSQEFIKWSNINLTGFYKP
mgnify:CR=1 FL=1